MNSNEASPEPAGPAFDISAFLGAAAHELANPLNAISMNAELAKLQLQRAPSTPPVEALERLLAECSRCGRVLRNIQKFASAVKARPRETVRTRALIEAAIARYLQERSGAKPAITADGIDEPVLVDRAAIERALAALLHNAAEAEATAIEILATRSGDALLIEVKDNGHGIADDVRPLATDAFFTTRRAAGHNGLGLTLAGMVSRAHAGEVCVGESRGDGTRVVMRLGDVRSTSPG